MNPVTPVQPSMSVTAAALLTLTHTSTLKYLLHSEGPQCRVQNIVDASPMMPIYCIIVGGSCGNYPLCSFPLLSAPLFHSSCSLWTPCPTYAVLQSYTHSDSAVEELQVTPVWNIQFCWIREFGEEIKHRHKRSSHMDIHTEHDRHCCWGILLLKTL